MHNPKAHMHNPKVHMHKPSSKVYLSKLCSLISRHE